jgi:hypothetical protein
MTMMLGLTLKTESRRGSQRRLGEGGRYLGIPRNGGPAAPRVESENAEAHNCGLLSVQETGCDTAGPSTYAIRATTDIILTRWWSVEAVATRGTPERFQW